MLEWNAEEQRLEALHHPFTAPHPDDISDLKTARAQAYDLVLNGFEISGGSLRIYQREIQEQVFDAIGLSPEEANNKFGFLLEAFEYGTDAPTSVDHKQLKELQVTSTYKPKP